MTNIPLKELIVGNVIRIEERKYRVTGFKEGRWTLVEQNPYQPKITMKND